MPTPPDADAEWQLVRVPSAYHVEVDGHYDSLPYGLVKQQLDVRLSAQGVEIFHQGTRVASHQRSPLKGHHPTVAVHRPKAHQHSAAGTPQRRGRWAAHTGAAIAHVVDTMLASRPHPPQGFRACLGRMRLGNDHQPLRYVDLMGGQKPHLLSRVVNNLGAETTLTYAPSTRFYLADEQAGRPWITRLPFPVHVVDAVEVLDRLSQTRYVTRYAYHHGYVDGQEREFRGFGLVEQWDTDTFPGFAARDPWPASPHGSEAAHHQPPVYTKSWFHTGAFLDREAISSHYEAEYYAGDPQARLLPDTVLPADLTVEETREACRALRGRQLRQEVYAVDGTAASPHPYAVTEQNFELRMLQPRRDERYAVFLSHAREAISYHYERNPADPCISHAFTLDVDDHGNVTRAAAVAYPRRATIPDRLPEQDQLYLTCSEAEFVNRADGDDFYLVKIPYESRSYELTRLTPAADGFFDWAELRAAIASIPPDDELPYEATPDGNRVQKRLLARTRTRYYRDDLAAPLDWDEMDRGEITAPLLPYETYQAVFSRALLETIYGEKIGYDALTAILQGQAGDHGGYVFEDELWWVPSGRQIYAPNDATDPAAYTRAHFCLPVATQDPFRQHSRLAYDEPYLLFPTRVEDPLGNVVQAEIDYRVLQPWQITDPNGNRSQAAFDALGMVVGTAIQGKAAEILGDSLVDFTSELGRDTIRASLDAADPRTEGQTLLGSATTRLVYDLWRYHDTRDDAQPQPNVVWSIARETHVSDLVPDQAPRLQHRFLYSDGLGREILTKAQAEPGPLQLYDPATGQWRDEWAGPEQQPFDPRWVGTGRTIFNNKGKPVKQYEPFFSATHRYESEAQAVMQGVTPILAYDSLGRLVRTDLPNKTVSRVEFDPWQQTSWDPNDTVFESGWYMDRDQPDPSTEPEPTDPERRAAWLATEHANTPAVQYLDSLGRPFLSVAHNREVRRDAAGRITEISEYRIPTRTQLDIEGNPLQINDGRGIDVQPTAEPLTYADGNVVMRYRYAMGGLQLYQKSMDAGERWILNDVLGKPIRAWDNRGHAFRNAYDRLRRPVRQFVRGTDATYSDPRTLNQEVLFQKIEYGEGQAHDIGCNLRTRVFKSYDSAGIVTSERYDFKGNLLCGSQQLAADYKSAPDWSGSVSLEEQTFTTSASYDALNRPISLTSPDNSEIRPRYNEANLLDAVEANLRGEQANGQSVWTLFVSNIDYNAQGQRQRIVYDSGVETIYDYDPFTFRLTNLRSERGADMAVLQDLSYTYDPAGNITEIRDDAQRNVFFANAMVAPNARYAYDALSQLVKATGREHMGQASQVDHTDRPYLSIPHPNDLQTMGRYTEHYEYDAVGNILSMIHRASRGNWTRRYAYAADSNRLLATSLPGDRPAGPHSARYTYDAHGNMTRMPHLPLMQWDYRDQLQASAQQVRADGGTPEITYYVYDAGGQRAHKVTERQAAAGETPTRMKERIYLSGFEVYREYDADGSTVSLERETLHLMDGQERVALVETRTRGDDGSPDQLIRYQLNNHLGSASLELNEAGDIISYEEYYPYGSTSYQAVRSQTETPKRYRYTGMERDEETGFNYHNARYLCTHLGRWLNPDPASLRDSINIYSLVQNNPIKLIDLSGLGSNDTQSWPEYLSSYCSMDEWRKWSNQLALGLNPMTPAFESLGNASRGEYVDSDYEFQRTANSTLELINAVLSVAGVGINPLGGVASRSSQLATRQASTKIDDIGGTAVLPAAEVSRSATSKLGQSGASRLPRVDPNPINTTGAPDNCVQGCAAYIASDLLEPVYPNLNDIGVPPRRARWITADEIERVAGPVTRAPHIAFSSAALRHTPYEAAWISRAVNTLADNGIIPTRVAVRSSGPWRPGIYGQWHLAEGDYLIFTDTNVGLLEDQGHVLMGFIRTDPYTGQRWAFGFDPQIWSYVDVTNDKFFERVKDVWKIE